METVLNPLETQVEALVRKAQSGSREAFASLVRLHQRAVRAFVSRHIGDGTVADDIAQEVFVRAFQGLATFRGSSPFGAWLIGIARNLVIVHLRQRMRQNASELSTALADARLQYLDDDPFDSEFEQAQLDALQSCLDDLIDEHAKFIWRFYFQGETAESIAELTGRLPGTVRMTLLRIRGHLKDCIQGKLGRFQ